MATLNSRTVNYDYNGLTVTTRVPSAKQALQFSSSFQVIQTTEEESVHDMKLYEIALPLAQSIIVSVGDIEINEDNVSELEDLVPVYALVQSVVNATQIRLHGGGEAGKPTAKKKTPSKSK